ncbi:MULTISPECIES: cell division FtsA domain-containing protein [Butyricimonas]|uniref:cell division FtsA domain-containing protein n=1 Tax=Butyricimonas TaxID=574697 RepID=UPI001D06CA78|nr:MULTISPECIES: cell division FtsA domain-containing protein [Butyricimonas]MCB6971867.1 cell division protein FtsA [Butyricimonas synergistica]MCG4518875.1 cell division protein FtsA [Butyricimonas sp. DFI.6.44]
MGFVASLDMGSEKMVMALGETSGGECRLVGIESVASQGIHRGMVVDRLRVKSCVQRLLDKFKQEHEMHIDALNIALAGEWVQQVEEREVSKFSRMRRIEESDLLELEKKCRGNVNLDMEEIVDVVPFGYWLDGEAESDPIGCEARRLEIDFHVYVARKRMLEGLRQALNESGIEKINFYSAATAAQKALVVRGRKGARDFALIDLGAESVKIHVFRDGMIAYDEVLPLGCNTVERDINTAFSIESMASAKKLKHEYGMALQAECKSRKIMIPDTKYCIDLQDMVHVEQCRLEELLEGAIWQILKSGYYKELEDGILLTGGGSRVQGIDTLLNRLSKHPISMASVVTVKSAKETPLKAPENLTVLGLLRCERKETKKRGWFDSFFKE